MDLKWIKGYEGLYQADLKGDIYSTKRPYTKGGKLTKVLRNGYYCVCLCKSGKKKVYRVNRLIAIAFINNPEKKPQVNHIDGNKLNDYVSNLEWNTAKENNNHALNMGLKKNKISLFSDKDCLMLYKSRKIINKKLMAQSNNVNLSTIYRAINKGKELTIN